MSVQNIVNITEANLQQVLEQSMVKPVLFYFWSERSQHCLQLTPVLESLAAQYNGQFILAKLDCDAEPMVASQFGLRAIPTVYLFQNTFRQCNGCSAGGIQLVDMMCLAHGDIVCRELIHDFSQILIESGEDADSQAEIGRPEECFAPFRTELLDLFAMPLKRCGLSWIWANV